MQEAAQLLSGPTLPAALLTGLLSNLSDAASKNVKAINLTPYDGHWERCMMRRHLTSQPRVRSLSLSTDLTRVDFVKQLLGLGLLQAHDSGQ